VPVLDRPFIEHVLLWLKRYGVEEAVLTLSHLAPAIQETLGDGNRLGIKVSYVQEPSPLGTAGAVRNAGSSIEDTFLVLNGDIYTELDLSAMLALHRAKGSIATIALTAVDNPSAYGLVETQSGGRITRFLEKPAAEEITTNFINAGTYVLEPQVLQEIPPGQPYSFERELFPQLLAAGQPLFAYPDQTYWIDIGTPAKYLALNQNLLCGRVGHHGFPNGTEIVVLEGSQIEPGAVLKGPLLISSGCRVGAGVTIIGPAVIGAGCRIDEGAAISGCVIWQNVSIGARAQVLDSIVAHNTRLGADCRVEKAVIGANVLLSAGYQLEPGSSVPPDTMLGYT
jgi:mannose-1-phosphate guanylyltransferase